MSRLTGEVVLVTGGSSGIGLAIARRFAASGARVVLAARDEARLGSAVREIGPAARGTSVDLTESGSVRSLAEGIEDAEGRLDVLVNCAGQLEIGPATDLGPDVAERLMNVNYLASVRVTHALLPLLSRGERRSVVNVSSVAALVSPPFMAAYAASKAALSAYTRSLRQELAPDAFHVGLVMPGPVETPMISGRVRTRHYPLPPGLTIISAERVAIATERLVLRRTSETVLPYRLSGPARLAAAFPLVVDRFYGLLR